MYHLRRTLAVTGADDAPDDAVDDAPDDAVVRELSVDPEPAKRLGCNGRRRSGLARVADLAVAAL